MELPYVVLQVTLKEKFLGTGSGNLEDLEEVINSQFAKGYRLFSMSTSNGGSKGFGGGDRIQATLVFEKLNLEEAYIKMKAYIKEKEDNSITALASKLAVSDEGQEISENTLNTETVKQDVKQDNKCEFVKIDDDTIKCCNCGEKQSIYRLKLGCRICGYKFI